MIRLSQQKRERSIENLTKERERERIDDSNIGWVMRLGAVIKIELGGSKVSGGEKGHVYKGVESEKERDGRRCKLQQYGTDGRTDVRTADEGGIEL